MAAKEIPSYPQFNPSFDADIASKFEDWIEGLEALFQVVLAKPDTDDKPHKYKLLFHYMGQDCRKVFKRLENNGLGTGDYDLAKTALTTHFAPNQKDLFLMNQFLMTEQLDGETMDNYHIRLKEKITPIKMEDKDGKTCTELLLLSQLVAKCRDISLKKRALRDDMKLTDFLKAARSHETAEKEVSVMRGYTSSAPKLSEKTDVCALRRQHTRGKPQHRPREGKSQDRRPSSNSHSRKKMCIRCGDPYPHSDERPCRAVDAECDFCHRKGHYSKVCISKKKSGKQAPRNGRNVNSVNNDEVDDDDYFGFGIKMISTTPEEMSSSIITAVSQSKNGLYVDVSTDSGKVTFLADTGSPIDIISETTYKQNFSSYTLRDAEKPAYGYGPNGKDKVPIPILGTIDVTLRAHGKEITSSCHVLQGDAMNLLSFNSCTQLGFITVAAAEIHSVVSTVKLTPATAKDLFKDRFIGMGKMNIPPIKLHINKDVKPIRQRPYTIAFHNREKVEKELERLKIADIIEDSKGATPWISPIVPIHKDDGTLRITVDSRCINTAIDRENHPMPTLDDLIYWMNGSTIFSKIDLNKGYHQLELDEESRYITTFTTHVGLFRYKRLSFGINSAAEIFQKAVYDMVKDIKGVKNISDDIIIGTATDEEHDVALQKLYTRMKEYNVTANEKKCIFKAKKIKFYGNEFSDTGVSADYTKIEAIIRAPEPKDKAELRSFLGSTNYLSQYVQNYSSHTAVLRQLLRDDTKWVWKKKQQKAFQMLKDKMTDCQTLSYFNIDLTTEVIVDAGPEGLGAILTQIAKGGQLQVVGFGSRTLTDVEKHYSQTEREALGVVFGCEHFDKYLYGAAFLIKTDHKPLLGIMNNPTSTSTARLRRLCLRLQPYKCVLDYIQGKFNSADYLSRHPEKRTVHPPCTGKQIRITYINAIQYAAVTVPQIREATAGDETLQKVISLISSQRWFEGDESTNPYKKVRNELSLVDGLVMRGDLIVIPTRLRHAVVKSAHSSHQGIVKTKNLLRESVWFPSMSAMVEAEVKSCLPCQATKPGNPAKDDPTSRRSVGRSIYGFRRPVPYRRLHDGCNRRLQSVPICGHSYISYRESRNSTTRQTVLSHRIPGCTENGQRPTDERKLIHYVV